MGLRFLSQSKLPYKFWWDAFVSAVYTINRLPTPLLHNLSPFEKLYHKRPDYSFLKTFGCSCFPYLRPYNSTKLQFRSAKCVFLGYSPSHKGYRCLSTSGRIYISRTVAFNEQEFPYTGLFSTSTSVKNPYPTPLLPALPLKDSLDRVVSPEGFSLSSSVPSSSENNAPLPSPLCPSSPVPPDNISLHPMQTRSKSGIYKPKTFCFSLLTEPSTVKEALSDPHWKAAMEEEFVALVKNNTWELVPYRSGMKVVDNKWVFKLKQKKDGTIDRYKARLVAKGFQQTAGVDYFDTFSPVVKHISIRILFALAVTKGWKIRDIDINNAFLHGDLKEVVYMSQPAGFIDLVAPTHVCKLVKAIYGLKQAPRAWNDKIRHHLISIGFQASASDTSLFFLKACGQLILILIYVDDILVTGDDAAAVQRIIQDIAIVFALKDLGEVSFFLGVEVHTGRDATVLMQTKYIRDLLEKTNMLQCSSVLSPYSSGQKLFQGDSEPFCSPTVFRSVIGALQYVALTRPDISYIVNKLSQFMHTPTVLHWKACKRVLRYLKGTMGQGLSFQPSSRLMLEAFTDADWASSLDDRKSTSGFCVFLGQNLITWSSRKQTVVARSSTEAEYRALANGTADLVWITSLFTELGLQIEGIPVVWCDNVSAISLASNPVFHTRTKHIEVDIHFIREKIQQKQLEVRFVSSEDQLGDVFTKALPVARFQFLCRKFSFTTPPGFV